MTLRRLTPEELARKTRDLEVKLIMLVMHHFDDDAPGPEIGDTMLTALGHVAGHALGAVSDGFVKRVEEVFREAVDEGRAKSASRKPLQPTQGSA